MSLEHPTDANRIAAAVREETVEAAATAHHSAHNNPTVTLLCRRLQAELAHMGQCLRCGICLATVRDARLLSQCCHVYCAACITRALHGTARGNCPTCQQPCTRRSLLPAPSLDMLVLIYKRALQVFGLAPLRYDAQAPMTQIMPHEYDHTALPAAWPQVREQDHVLVAHTFGRVLRALPDRTSRVLWQEHQHVLRGLPPPPPPTTTTAAAMFVASSRPGQDQADDDDEEHAEHTPSRAKSVTFVEDFADVQQTLSPAFLSAQEEEDEDDRKPAAGDNTCTTENDNNYQESTSTSILLPIDAVDASAAAVQAALACSASLARAAPAVNVTESSATPVDEVTVLPLARSTLHTPSYSDATTIAAISMTASSSTTRHDTPRTLPPADTMPLAAPTPLTKDDVNAAAPTTGSATAARCLPDCLSVGSLVKVESRTWEGINKPGGVGRVTKVHMGNSHSSQKQQQQQQHRPTLVQYDIAYVLGGSEKRVDAQFCACHEDLLTDNMRGRRRCSQERGLSPTLLRELKQDGCDVDGAATARLLAAAAPPTTKIQVAVPTTARRPSRRASVLPTVQTAPRSQRNTKRARVTPDDDAAPPSTDNRPRKRRTRVPASYLRAAEPAPTPATAAAVTNTTWQPVPPPPPTPTLAPINVAAAATARYQARIQDAMLRGCLQVVASGLSEPDKKALAAFCKLTQTQAVTVKLSENFDPKKTTMSIVTTAHQRVEQAKSRTLKAMRAALAGVPIVAVEAWLPACRQAGQFVMPADFVQSLPIRTESVPVFHNGVIQLAAQKATAQSLLDKCAVFLCGSMGKGQSTSDVQRLLRDANAKVLTSVAAAIAIIKKKHSETQKAASSLIIICNDPNGVSIALEKAIHEHATARAISSVSLVPSSWLFDSIAAGTLLPCKHYAPDKKTHAKLFRSWKRLQA